MGGLFKGASNKTKSQPAATTLRIQTSIAGRPRPIGAGQNRVAGNLVWWGDFKAEKQKSGSKGGVGAIFGKGGTGSYAYHATGVVSIGEGPIASIDTVWNGDAINFYSTPSAETLADLASIGITPTYGNTYPVTFLVGTYPQAPWSYIASAHASQAIGYQGQALACFTNLSLGSSPTFPSFSWEVTWGLNASLGSTTKDVNAAEWVQAFLTNSDWGVLGFPSALLGDLSAAVAYCRAYGLFMSPLLSDQTTAQSHLADVMRAIGADFKWSVGQLTIGLYADAASARNGVTFTPALTPVYDLTDADFIPDAMTSEPSTVRVTRKNPSDAINGVQVEYLDRGYLYNPVVVQLRDDADILASGWENLSDLRAYHFWALRRAAVQSTALQLARERVMATYNFTLGAQYELLEPFDVVSLTEPRLGLDKRPVRITEIQETNERCLQITAEEIPATGGYVSYAIQAPLGSATNSLSDPGANNDPIIFEPPATLAANQIWLVVSGANPAIWGGCNVWISTDGGSSYAQVGQVIQPGRQGLLSAALPSVARSASGLTRDNTNTLAVDLSGSQAALGSGSAADLTAMTTLCYVGGELVSYQTATLTAAYRYSLAPLIRGAYGSPIAAHAIGSAFARLDEAVFKQTYAAGQIGSTIKIKLQPFNIYGGGAPDLSTLTAYSYTVLGAGVRTETSTVTTTAAAVTVVTFSQRFASGPSGSPVPFVNISWTTQTGDTLEIVEVTTVAVKFGIRNGGAYVARTATVVVQGY